MITYEVNRAELELVEKKLGDMKSKAPQVFKNAVNKTARQARKRIAQSAKGAYTVKQVGFNSHMKIKNASTGNLTASVDADGKPLTLVRFKNRAGRPKKGGAAAAADIVNGGGKAKTGSRSRCFIQTLSRKWLKKYIRAREEWQEHLKSRYSQTFARTSKQRSRRLWGKP